MQYPVNEVFVTIQGEGHWTGTPSIFIRLQGCPVGCPWCDTKHTWPSGVLAQEMTSLALVTEKPSASESWAMASLPELGEYVAQHPPVRHVVLTGGEPCQYDLEVLANYLERRHRCQVQVETSGTFTPRVTPATWLTVSPKVNMPGGYRVLDEALTRADEIKMPVGRGRDLDNLALLLGRCKRNVLVYLQPLSLSRNATRLCCDQAIAHGWRVSLQTHRLGGWP